MFSEGITDINLVDVEFKIGEYKRAIETYYNAFGLYTQQNNLTGKVIDITEIDYLMELNQKIIDTKNDLVKACRKFIKEA